MNKTAVIALSAMVVIGGGSFYGGMKYGQSHPVAGIGQFSRADFQNLSPAERQQRLQDLGANAGGFRGTGAGSFNRGGSVNGEVISKDSKSVTVKLADGGSKIVFLSDSTTVSKSAAGSLADLGVGTQIRANGTANQDGSITASSIQLLPPMPAGGVR